VEGRREVSLDIYGDRATPAESFYLRPKPRLSGPLEIALWVYLGHERLGSLKLVVHVVPGPEERKRCRASLRVAASEEWGATPPDVVLYVDCQPQGAGDTLCYSYQWVKQGWSRTEAGQVHLGKTVSDFLRPIYEELNASARGALPDPSKIENIGQNLYNALFTPKLKKFYEKFWRETKTLLLYSNEPWIPWELLFPWQVGLEPQDFLCAKFAMARWYNSEHGQRIQPSTKLRMIGVATPALNVAADDEVAYLNDLPQRWPSIALARPMPSNARQLLDLMQEQRVNLLHFATHGHLRTAQPEIDVAAIAVGRDYLRINEITGNVGLGIARSRPLVFINACHSARQDWGLTGVDGWVTRLLELDCSAFLGANWEIESTLASRFALAVYDRLLRNEPAAQAVREARLMLRAAEPGNSTWLAYSLFADPNMRVQL
jgi:hypothetical protein